MSSINARAVAVLHVKIVGVGFRFLGIEGKETYGRLCFNNANHKQQFEVDSVTVSVQNAFFLNI